MYPYCNELSNDEIPHIGESTTPEQEQKDHDQAMSLHYRIQDARRKGLISEDDEIPSDELNKYGVYPKPEFQGTNETTAYEVQASRDGGNFWSQLDAGKTHSLVEAVNIFQKELELNSNQMLRIISVTRKIVQEHTSLTK